MATEPGVPQVYEQGALLADREGAACKVFDLELSRSRKDRWEA
jgi:hypothetical protein